VLRQGRKIAEIDPRESTPDEVVGAITGSSLARGIRHERRNRSASRACGRRVCMAGAAGHHRLGRGDLGFLPVIVH